MSLIKCFLLMTTFYGTSANIFQYFEFLPKEYESMVQDNTLSANESYCFKFTWLGRSYDNRTYPAIANKTCDEYLNYKEKPLCVDPMVATYTGGEPDTDWMWSDTQNPYKKYVNCRLSDDEVCAKFTYYYNGLVKNVTRYCTRINVDLESSMTSGCITENMGVYKKEVCACRSNNNEPPCNSTAYVGPSGLITLMLFMLSSRLDRIVNSL